MLSPALVAILVVAASQPTSRDAPANAGNDSPQAPRITDGDAKEPAELDTPREDAARDALSAYDLVGDNVWRVRGSPDVRVERGTSRGVTTYRFDSRMLIDTKLPVGYPQPTPPDVLEIKAYPTVRRAEVTGRGNPDLGMNMAFWPLFNHIDRNHIAMTAPVEIDYAVPTLPSLDESVAPASVPPDGWTMSFLYEQQSDGPTGDFGRIAVVDRDPVLVLAIGLRGSYRYSRMEDAMAHLHGWLNDHPEWVVAGDPRMLGYNGPDRRPADQWSELQVPIRLAEAGSTPLEPAKQSAPDLSPNTGSPPNLGKSESTPRS